MRYRRHGTDGRSAAHAPYEELKQPPPSIPWRSTRPASGARGPATPARRRAEDPQSWARGRFKARRSSTDPGRRGGSQRRHRRELIEAPGMANIHATTVVDPNADLGTDVVIGRSASLVVGEARRRRRAGFACHGRGRTTIGEPRGVSLRLDRRHSSGPEIPRREEQPEIGSNTIVRETSRSTPAPKEAAL